MKTYADTSFLVSLYVSDAHSERANAWMKGQAESLPFTPLHRHEVRNAIRLAVWRKEIGGAERLQVLRLIDADLKEGFFTYQPVAWTDAFREAERIGDMQTELTGLRATDLLHLGIALSLEATEFLSFDKTQRKAAVGAGLKCKP